LPTGDWPLWVGSLIGSLTVVKILIMWEWCVSREDMNDAGHILMKQAHLLEISEARKLYDEGCSLYKSGGNLVSEVREPAGTAHDRWAVKGGSGRTSDRLEKRSGLVVGYECYGMDLVGVERPFDVCPGKVLSKQLERVNFSRVTVDLVMIKRQLGTAASLNAAFSWTKG
jgi:hypothetical protein